jgi:hypothetical protein
MRRPLRVLVGTLSCGENELDRCIEALHRQAYRDWEQFIVANLPERDAHERLYAGFMERRGEFDLFLKLDADMVFPDPHRLGTAVELFRRDAILDHAIFRVHDWMSEALLVGVHVFRSRVRWGRCDPLFPDVQPQRVRRRRYVLRRPPGPLALHSPDPDPRQAFRYGLHRGMKAFQVKRPHFALVHWRLLKRVWAHFERCGDRRLGLALLAAEHAMAGDLAPADCDYGSSRMAELFSACADLPADVMAARLGPVWGGRAVRELRFVAALGRRAAARLPSAASASRIRSITGSRERSL